MCLLMYGRQMTAELLELALLENLQREDLNAIEIALSYKRMMDELELYTGTGGRTHG